MTGDPDAVQKIVSNLADVIALAVGCPRYNSKQRMCFYQGGRPCACRESAANGVLSALTERSTSL